MSKRNKKRTKRYQGEDAASASTPSEPIVHHYSAVDRGRFGQWWYEKKRTVKLTAKIVAITLVIIWLLYELLRIVT